MKKNSTTMQLVVPRRRTRAHVVLFCAGSPFKPKTVANKKAYQRRNKHGKTDQDLS